MTPRRLDRMVLWLALAVTAAVAVLLPVVGGSGAQDAVVGLMALLVLAVVLGRLRAERGDRRRIMDQNRELRALLAERGREQERTETLYRVGQRLSGETGPTGRTASASSPTTGARRCACR